MREPEEFDAFYKDTRDGLLAQTYALTGDLAASRRAVRDAYVMAWHHWGKLSRLERPEVVVRPRAWRQAQRRHTARLWARQRGLAPEVKATLDALGELPMIQRRAVLLTTMADVTLVPMAREIGLPVDRAERELQAAVAYLADARSVPPAAVRGLMGPVADSVREDARWPRATIIRRQGAARRRTHTSVGAVAAVAALLVTGTLVTDAAGVRPTLDRDAAPVAPPSGAPTSPDAEAAEPVVLPTTSLLRADQVQQTFSRRTWSVGRTGNNSEGDGLVLPCQTAPYADPRGDAALVRTFRAAATGARALPALSATQMTEASPSPERGERAFGRASAWFAGCTESRVQLLVTRTPERIGDEAVQLVLRSWDDPVTTYVVGVARTGIFTTTTVVTQRSGDRPDRTAAARVLSDAVNGLCQLPGGGSCATTRPTILDRDPLPVGDVPALLSTVDLPPIGDVDLPWAGTEPTRATRPVAFSACDEAVFDGRFEGARFTNNLTRTFVVPDAGLPDEFGLTETVGALPVPQARAFVEQVRSTVAGCPDDDLGTEVEQVTTADDGDTALTVWRLDVEVTDERSLSYWLAVLRDGTSVGQVDFVPTPDGAMSDEAFLALAERALARLGELPAPSRPAAGDGSGPRG